MTRETGEIELTIDEWEETLAAARTLDLIHGGYFRVQSNHIRIFCGPGNRPEGWPEEYPHGSPGLPRAEVGAAEEVERTGEGLVRVRIVVARWAHLRRLSKGNGPLRRLAREALGPALRGSESDGEWLRRRFEDLRGFAAGRLVA